MAEARAADQDDGENGAERGEDSVEALSDDVARLLQAVRDVAADQHRWGEAFRAVVTGHVDAGGPAGAGAGGAAARASSSSSGPEATCRACPVCQGLTVLRETRPEAYDHLARAVSAAAEAMRVLLDPSRSRAASDYSPGPQPDSATDREATPAGCAGRPDRARPEPVVAERIEIDQGAQ